MSICIISKGTDTNVNYDKAIDYLNCNLVKLYLKKGDKSKFNTFDNKCDCNTADYNEITNLLLKLDAKQTSFLSKAIDSSKSMIRSNPDKIKDILLEEISKIDGNFWAVNKQDLIDFLEQNKVEDLINKTADSLKSLDSTNLSNHDTGAQIATSDSTSVNVEEPQKPFLEINNITDILSITAILLSSLSIIISFLKRKEKGTTNESIINALLTDQKVKEYIQKQASSIQPVSNYANNSNQFEDLKSRITDLEKIVNSMKSDTGNVTNLTNTSNLEIKEKVEIFYLSTPNMDGSFNESSSSAIYKEGATIYKFTKTSFNKAKFEIDSKSASMKLALQYPDKNIDPVCDAVGPYFPTATRIATIQPGEAELQGDKWIRNTKAKISYES